MRESTINDVIHAALNYRRIWNDQSNHAHWSKDQYQPTTLGHARRDLFHAIDRLPQSINQRSKGRILK